MTIPIQLFAFKALNIKVAQIKQVIILINITIDK